MVEFRKLKKLLMIARLCLTTIFSGCGKKRSDESMGTLVEMNSEPAVAELSRQILSEAKLWEAIQEARLELMRRREKHEQKQRQMQMQVMIMIPA